VRRNNLCARERRHCEAAQAGVPAEKKREGEGEKKGVSVRNEIGDLIRQENYIGSLFIGRRIRAYNWLASDAMGNDINMWRSCCIKRKCGTYFAPFNVTLIGRFVINELLPYIMPLRLSKVSITTMTRVGAATIGGMYKFNTNCARFNRPPLNTARENGNHGVYNIANALKCARESTLLGGIRHCLRTSDGIARRAVRRRLITEILTHVRSLWTG